MSEHTAISWCDSTFNPWIGCTKVSPACDHCYAARQDAFRKWTPEGWGGPRRRTSAALWRQPLLWEREHEAFMLAHGRRRRVFCASLADVFDNDVPPEWRADLFALISQTPHLDWLLLTKRIGNAAQMMFLARGGHLPLLPNIWLGATICNQEEADRDIPKLLAVPARVRFLSIEPMLGPITLPGFNARTSWCPVCKTIVGDSLGLPHELQHGVSPMAAFDPGKHCASVYDMLHWVICGGESGPQARPMHPDWVRSLRDQCAAAGVPFHFKQWGEWTPGENVERQRGTVDTAFLWDDGWHVYPLNLATDHGHIDDQPDLYRVGAKAAGRLLDGRTHDEFPT